MELGINYGAEAADQMIYIIPYNATRLISSLSTSKAAAVAGCAADLQLLILAYCKRECVSPEHLDQPLPPLGSKQ